MAALHVCNIGLLMVEQSPTLVTSLVSHPLVASLLLRFLGAHLHRSSGILFRCLQEQEMMLRDST